MGISCNNLVLTRLTSVLFGVLLELNQYAQKPFFGKHDCSCDEICLQSSFG